MEGSARFRLPIRSRGTTACFPVIAIVESLATRGGLSACTSSDPNRRLGADRLSKGTDAGRSAAPRNDMTGRRRRWLRLLSSKCVVRLLAYAMEPWNLACNALNWKVSHTTNMKPRGCPSRNSLTIHVKREKLEMPVPTCLLWHVLSPNSLSFQLFCANACSDMLLMRPYRHRVCCLSHWSLP